MPGPHDDYFDTEYNVLQFLHFLHTIPDDQIPDLAAIDINEYVPEIPIELRPALNDLQVDPIVPVDPLLEANDVEDIIADLDMAFAADAAESFDSQPLSELLDFLADD